MSPYFGAVISLDSDMEYLPQSFQDEINSLPGSISTELTYTSSGGTGYAFKIDEDEITVYIS